VGESGIISCNKAVEIEDSIGAPIRWGLAILIPRRW
jgi:hypothetical protein